MHMQRMLENHERRQCPFFNTKCAFCNKLGHIEKLCFMKEKDYNLVIYFAAYPHIVKNKKLLNNIIEEYVTINTINEKCFSD
jgi:hypothetical protein